MSNKEQEYHPGKLKPMVQIIANIIRSNPRAASDTDYLMACIGHEIPGFNDRTKCANCHRSMKVVTYTADLHDALLILAMARAVKVNIDKGMNFTEANKVHMPTLDVSNTVSKRQTKCDYLGLLKQPPGLKSTGYWVLTNWAWKALKGQPVPKHAYYWAGEMHGRSEETTTLIVMFNTHLELIKKAIANSKKVRADHRDEIGDYDPSEWVNYHGVKDGELF